MHYSTMSTALASQGIRVSFYIKPDKKERQKQRQKAYIKNWSLKDLCIFQEGRA